MAEVIEETFVAPTPRDAFELAREKYGAFSDLKILRATQQCDEEGRFRAYIVVSVPKGDYLTSIGVDGEERSTEAAGHSREPMDRSEANVSQSDAVDAIREMMLGKGLPASWLDSLLNAIRDQGGAEDKSLLLAHLLEAMDERLRVEPERIDAAKRLMLIGPTGVGKTTTLAKLAARFTLDPVHPRTVALVNLDTFRVGAYEQMEHYAAALGLTHRKVDTIEGFSTVLEELADHDVILIDTAGISPYDIGRLVKTVEFLKRLPPEENIETALVVSATAKFDDIVAIYDHFSFVEIGSVILTKFDETRRIGEALGFVLERGLPVSYVSNGQEVPDDLEPADKENLMIRFVEELHV